MTETQIHPRRAVVFVWGYNNSGGLGLGHSARAYLPVPAQLPGGIAGVQGGGEFTVARTASGELYAWGGNMFGQLGDGTTKTRLAWARVPLPGARSSAACRPAPTMCSRSPSAARSTPGAAITAARSAAVRPSISWLRTGSSMAV